MLPTQLGLISVKKLTKISHLTTFKGVGLAPAPAPISRLFAEFLTNMAIANGDRCKVGLSFSKKKIFHGNLEQTGSKEPVSVPLPSARIIESSCILPLAMPMLLPNQQ
jgi:hypothetical protein